MTTTLFTTVEVAERLGLSLAAVAQAVRGGQLEAAAQTADDFLFSERAITAFELARAQAAAEPAAPAPEGSRAEWSSELGRLSGWLGELNASLVDPQPPAAPPAAPEPPPAPPEPPPAVAAEPEPAPPPVAVAKATIRLDTPAFPEPVVLPGPPRPSPDLPPRRPGPSRQVILVVQPIDRFRTLAELARTLSRLPGLADARLESIDRGVASYRLTMADEPAAEPDIVAAVDAFHLRALLVEPGE